MSKLTLAEVLAELSYHGQFCNCESMPLRDLLTTLVVYNFAADSIPDIEEGEGWYYIAAMFYALGKYSAAQQDAYRLGA